MKSINSHLSIVLSVFVMLFSFQFTHFVTNVVDAYAAKMLNDYSIIVVASTEIKEEALKEQVVEIRSLSEISSKKILDRLKNDMSSKNLSLLQVALPKFYTLKLETLPTKKRMEEIKQKLLANSSITRIETFAKTHDKIFKMFELLQYMVIIFTSFIAIIAILLIFKQVRIWTYEHNRRMAIMTLFGASFFMKSAMLYRMTLVDSLISAFLVCGIYSAAPHLSIIQELAEDLEIVIPPFDFIYEGLPLIGAAVLFSILSVSLVSRKIGRV